MAANSSLVLTSLDFDSLKQNLIQFLQSQTIFKSYNFTGSNLNVLMDLLSYNTYTNSFYLNMAACEAFLDSAQMRNSVVSTAKQLNYIPRSARSAVGTVNINFNTSGLNGILTIPSGTLFGGKNSNGNFQFVTNQTHTLLSAGNQFTASNINVYEGKLFTESFMVDNTIENQRFVLSNLNIDDTSIIISVSQNNSSPITYTQASNLYGLNSNSTVFFVQEDRGALYEIYFGDGVFGTVPINGSLITATYRITNGSIGNGVTPINLASDLGPVNGGNIISSSSTTVVASSNGSDLEDIETTRFRAPRHYQTQDRAITAPDYKDIIKENFPEVKDVNVYGGEDISGSVQYGTVFISVVTFDGSSLADARKTDIINFLQDKSNITSSLSIKDPNFLYIVPSIKVFVNFANTSLSASDIITEVTQNIANYNSSTLEKFKAELMLSKFNEVVDSSDTSIEGSSTSLTLYQDVLFANGFPQTVTVNFNMPLAPGSISSSNFVLSDGNIYSLTDFNPNNNTFTGANTSGSFGLVNKTNTIYFNQTTTGNPQNYLSAGVINYQTGQILIKSINVLNFMNQGGIVVKASPATDEIYGILNNVLEIDSTQLSISVIST